MADRDSGPELEPEQRKRRKVEEVAGEAAAAEDQKMAAPAPSASPAPTPAPAETPDAAPTPEPPAKEQATLPVIIWSEAMEQCADDVDFLWELLSDLKGEVTDQCQQIQNSLKAETPAWTDRTRRAAHAVKGAAANLMCKEIGAAASELEAFARNADGEDAAELQQAHKLAARLEAGLVGLSEYIAANGPPN